MKGISKGIMFILLLCIIPGASLSQSYPYDIPQYDYIGYAENKFQFFSDSQAFQDFYRKYYNLVKYGEGNISIVHIGGSHIQADVYTNRVRERIQLLYDDHTAARGFIFPYRMAQTNNPKNFIVTYTGIWKECSNTDKNRQCTLGLSGMSITTADSNATIHITFANENNIDYHFNKLKIYHEIGPRYYDFKIDAPEITQQILVNNILGYTEVQFSDFLQRMSLKISSSGTLQKEFVLYGISFESDEPGITYSAVGVNGASISSFLRCGLFSNHLQSLHPDLVIISLGTNDAYTSSFSEQEYRMNYIRFLTDINSVVPKAAILLTVPNDSYVFKRYVNKNTEKMETIIIALAKQYNCGVWDFYSIMGGLNSTYAWHKDGLMRNDKVHFTKEGYMLKGDLFFNAFLKGFDDYVDSRH